MTETTQDYGDSSFFGHPKGLITLFLTEMWERMSFYGMRGLLVLFMTREVTEGGLNLETGEAMAIYGIYGASVYFLCVPGGWVADKIFGAQKSVLIGAIIITLGHYVLAIPFEKTFFLGLVLVSIGTGFLKPNISTIVGQLYKPGDIRIDAGYTIFYMSINIGSMLGFLVCGYLGEKVGWHWGFGAAGVGMTFGVIQYILTRKSLGEAGLKPNLEVNEDASRYKSFFYIAMTLLVLIIGTNFLGFWSIDAQVLNQLTGLFDNLCGCFVFYLPIFLCRIEQKRKRKYFYVLIALSRVCSFLGWV